MSLPDKRFKSGPGSDQLQNCHFGVANSLTDRHPSPPFLVTICVLFLLSIVGKPIAQWTEATYDAYQADHAILTASDTRYRRLLKLIQAQQPGQTLSRSVPAALAIPEQIFQTAISRDLLGRSSRYEPNTSHGKLACARMVNRVVQKAFNYQIGQNPLYVPSVVQALEGGVGRRIEQGQTRRGDIAIANGTDYAKGLWHIGICVTDRCTLVLSNSPFTSRFAWLSDANFDGAFEQHPGKTTFYRVVKQHL
ncbi:MAG: hypothetical protein KME16_20145 [Scytolyngbya sp. HA4215-MV1]|jgi:hypothetical protein|nr:hypothetical protein [Scytolyngbya sp. HA4215-MV1]